ncbi:MAG: response regulator [Ignavibacteria bacterium]|jgi:CheY-like chemotaxis protein
MHYQTKNIEILLIEDNPGDVRLIKEAFKESKILNNFSVAFDGEQALDFLYKKGGFSNCPKPDIIFLDLNLPKKSGIEVLSEIKSHPELFSIPVVILTVSSAAENILKSYNLNANCYVTKPIDLDQFIDVVKTIEGFWFNAVKLPSLN